MKMMTKLMGILNVTPDSCFDQGRWFNPAVAIERGICIQQEGADMLDLGGESTRPGATPVSEQEELNRVLPVLKALKEQITIPISIDTMKPAVAAAALNAGASFINDVSGFRDVNMRYLAADTHVPICVMHMHETPQTMQKQPYYPQGIIKFLIEWFEKRIEELLQAGIKTKNIYLDPGFGFGKTVADNVEILYNLNKIKALGFPVLIGLSRKSFLGKLIHKSHYNDLLPATIAAHTIALQADVDIIRVHDIAVHRDVIDLIKSIKKL
jgi:dihydropteroate synthase